MEAVGVEVEVEVERRRVREMDSIWRIESIFFIQCAMALDSVLDILVVRGKGKKKRECCFGECSERERDEKRSDGFVSGWRYSD